MRKRTYYAEEVKRAIVEKLLHGGPATVQLISREHGINSALLYAWKKKFVTITGMNNCKKSPQDRNILEKNRLVVLFDELPEEQKGEFLRREGVYLENLKNWKNDINSMLLRFTAKNENMEEKKEIQDLRKNLQLTQQELRRKNEALAETAALLVLKKKALYIWGSEENL